MVRADSVRALVVNFDTVVARLSWKYMTDILGSRGVATRQKLVENVLREGSQVEHRQIDWEDSTSMFPGRIQILGDSHRIVLKLTP